MEFFYWLLNRDRIDEFMPHGHCFWWEPGILWSRVLSDLMTFIAYIGIAIAIEIIRRRYAELIPHRWVLPAFSLFIALCGLTHLLDVITVYVPWYRLDAILRVATGIFSAATLLGLIWVLPAALDNYRRVKRERDELERELSRSEKRLPGTLGLRGEA